MDIITIIFSIIAICLSVYQLLRDHNRQRMESTLNAFASLQVEVFDSDCLSTKIISEITEKLKQTDSDISNDETWRKATHAMAKIEHFSVGVNTGIYDRKTLNRLAGDYIIRKHSQLSPIINYKTEKASERKHYDEFDKMIEKLQKKRKMKKMRKIK